MAAVCVLPRGAEEGKEQTFTHPFSIVTNRPVAFSLYSSTTRSDRAGDIVSLDRGVDAREHPPLVTVRFGRKSREVELSIRLAVVFTEVGTLEVWCHAQVTEHRWRLQFQVRGPAEEADEADDTAATGRTRW